ncbi:hypothetical protein [Allonocardiopsis opalescens]|nr:hypothetical protein [Allonocardiopsis opalescens]
MTEPVMLSSAPQVLLGVAHDVVSKTRQVPRPRFARAEEALAEAPAAPVRATAASNAPQMVWELVATEDGRQRPECRWTMND